MSSTLRRGSAILTGATALIAAAAVGSGCGEGGGDPASGAAENTAATTEDRTGTSRDASPQTAARTSGRDLEQARDAALNETGGGQVISVDTDDDGGYDVDVIRGDEEITVDLDDAFRVVGVETEQRNEVIGPGADQARSAALNETGGGQVISVDTDDDGGYDVDVIRGDEEITVDLDDAFRVVGVETEQRNGDD